MVRVRAGPPIPKWRTKVRGATAPDWPRLPVITPSPRFPPIMPVSSSKRHRYPLSRLNTSPIKKLPILKSKFLTMKENAPRFILLTANIVYLSSSTLTKNHFLSDTVSNHGGFRGIRGVERRKALSASRLRSLTEDPSSFPKFISKK